jgi:hypothetical protein
MKKDYFLCGRVYNIRRSSQVLLLYKDIYVHIYFIESSFIVIQRYICTYIFIHINNVTTYIHVNMSYTCIHINIIYIHVNIPFFVRMGLKYQGFWSNLVVVQKSYVPKNLFYSYQKILALWLLYNTMGVWM